MNEKLIQICESIARIEALLNVLMERVESLERKEEYSTEAISQAKGVMRAAAFIASFFGAASALAIELMLRG